MKSTLKRALLLGALCGLSVSSIYSMEWVKKAINAVSSTVSTGPDFADVIVSDDMKQRLEQCAVELKRKVDGKAVLPNMLVAGKQSCKTKFVTKLAQYAGMACWHIDLHPQSHSFTITGFSAKKVVEDLEKTFKFIENAEKPSMFIITNAHFIGLRCEDVPEHAHVCYRAISGLLLKYLMKLRKKCVFVAVTDLPNQMDPAVLRRLNDHILFDELNALDADIQLEILNQAFDECFVQPQKARGKAMSIEEGVLSGEVRKRILAQFPVWTESGIGRFVMRLANAARMSEDKVLTPAMVKKVIDWEKEERKSGRIIW